MLLRRPRPLPRPHRVPRNNGVRPQRCALARDDSAGGGRERARLGRAGAREAVAEVEVGRKAAVGGKEVLDAVERVRGGRVEHEPAAVEATGWGGRCRCPIVEPVNAHEPPRAVVFDFNGTISDDEPLLAELCTLIFGEIGIDVTEERYFSEFARLLRPRDRRTRARPTPDRPTTDRRAAAGASPRPPHRALPRPRLDWANRIRRSPACVREIAERVPVAVASGAVRRGGRGRARGQRPAPAHGGRARPTTSPGEARPRGLPDRARPARRPRCRRAVVRGHPLRRHGGGRRRDAVRRRRCRRCRPTGFSTLGAEAVVAGLDWSIPIVGGLCA